MMTIVVAAAVQCKIQDNIQTIIGKARLSIEFLNVEVAKACRGKSFGETIFYGNQICRTLANLKLWHS